MILPNPFDDVIKLQFNESINGQIKVLNIHGKNVINKAFTGKTQSLNTSEWLPGPYFIKVISEKGKFRTRKVTKYR